MPLENDHGDSETSPLLQATLAHPEATIDPLPSGSGLNGYTHVPATKHSDDAVTVDREELGGEAAIKDRPVNLYEGLPEMKKQLKYIFPAVAIGVFLAAADQTLVASAAGRIGSDLNSLESTQWVATAYFLTLTSIQPLYGKLSDIFGRKECLLFAYSMFALGCLWCGLSNTMGSLVAARAFTGIGGSGMATTVSVILSDIVPLRERGIWQGILNMVFAIGASIGAPLGGFISDSIGWQWGFLGQFPICVLAIIAVSNFLRLPNQKKGDWRVQIRRVDFLGAITLIATIAFLLIGLDRGSNVSWTSPIALTCLCVSLPLTAVFFYVELRLAREPFAPGRIIFNRKLIGAFLVNFFCHAGYFGYAFYLPIFYQAVQGLNAADAGLRIVPGVIASVFGSLAVGYIMKRTGKLYWLTVASSALFALISVPMVYFVALDNQYSTLGLCIGLYIAATGTSGAVTTTLIALLSTAAGEDQAITTACSYLFRSLGSVIGLALQAAVFQPLLRGQLEMRLGTDEDALKLIESIRQSLDFVKTLPPETQELVRVSYAQAMPFLFGFVSCLASGTMISSWFVHETRIS